jgi:arylformamidase
MIVPMGGDEQYRAEFDAVVTFSNGGSLRVEGFRVDVPHRDDTADEVAELFVASLGLLMTDRVDLTGLRVFAEAHKGTRGGPSDTSGEELTPPRRLVDLSRPGTTLDGPDPLPLSAVADLPAVVVRTEGSAGRAVDVGSLGPFDVRGRAVLLHTGGDRDAGSVAPYLTAAGARWLVAHGAALVAIDAPTIDDPDRPARATVLAAGIPVVEHLTGLDQLPPHGARFTAVPALVEGAGPVPVRAFAAVP